MRSSFDEVTIGEVSNREVSIREVSIREVSIGLHSAHRAGITAP